MASRRVSPWRPVHFEGRAMDPRVGFCQAQKGPGWRCLATPDAFATSTRTRATEVAPWCAGGAVSGPIRAHARARDFDYCGISTRACEDLAPTNLGEQLALPRLGSVPISEMSDASSHKTRSYLSPLPERTGSRPRAGTASLCPFPRAISACAPPVNLVPIFYQATPPPSAIGTSFGFHKRRISLFGRGGLIGHEGQRVTAMAKFQVN